MVLAGLVGSIVSSYRDAIPSDRNSAPPSRILCEPRESSVPYGHSVQGLVRSQFRQISIGVNDGLGLNAMKLYFDFKWMGPSIGRTEHRIRTVVRLWLAGVSVVGSLDDGLQRAVLQRGMVSRPEEVSGLVSYGSSVHQERCSNRSRPATSSGA